MGSVNSFGSGIRVGGTVGFFMNLATDLVGYATSATMDRRGTLADLVVGTVITALAGGVIAAVLGMREKKKA